MNYFCCTLELASGLGTPLAADTLWGHLAWGIRYRQGNEALEAWFSRYDTAEAPLVLSDPFPAGRLPRPCLPQPPRPQRRPPQDELQNFKRFKKIDSISLAGWKQLQPHLSPTHLQELLRQESPVIRGEAAITHAGVNRLTGGTANAEGGTLFTTRQIVYPPGTRFEVWGHSPESLETVRNWFLWGLEGGYGRDAATGQGHLKLMDLSLRLPLPTLGNANAVMLLGPCIPRPGDPTRGFFQTTLKSGRVGGNFAIGELPGGVTQRQKFPVTLLQAGTILLTDQAPDSLGRVISGVHRWSGIRQYGIAPLLPVRLEDDLLNHWLLRPALQKDATT